MKYKGLTWWKTRTVFDLPTDMSRKDWQNVRFGKIVTKDTEGAIETEWKRDGERVYAKEIPNKGYSRTNMMWGLDEVKNGITYKRAYCMLDGKIYTTRKEA